jgi:23S rRNA pseudouridine1911/1915/1917 synthase
MKITYKEPIPQRIDKYLSSLDLPEIFSRAYVDKLITKGNVQVNGKLEKKSYKLQTGDELEITFPEPPRNEIIPQEIPLDIVWEDEYLLIVNKPAGLTVHPAAGNPDGTLVNGLVYHFKENLSTGVGDKRPGIVHRLDKDTSGLLIVAKDDRTHAKLSEMFQERNIEKIYLAITVNAPSQTIGTIDTFIDRSKTDRKKMAVSSSGKRAVTHYEVLQDYDFFSVCRINLETGRTHQIRVHFSHLNCPILGDITYSSLKRTLNTIPHNFHKKAKHLLANHMQRQALHAHKLKFIHPIAGKEISVEAPIPQDMEYTMNWLEKNFDI